MPRQQYFFNRVYSVLQLCFEWIVTPLDGGAWLGEHWRGLNKVEELLELLLSTFKISRIKIKKPANITIVLLPNIFQSDDLEIKIDLTKIKEIY